MNAASSAARCLLGLALSGGLLGYVSSAHGQDAVVVPQPLPPASTEQGPSADAGPGAAGATAQQGADAAAGRSDAVEEPAEPAGAEQPFATAQMQEQPAPLPTVDPSVHRSSQPRLEIGAKLVARSLTRDTNRYTTSTCADPDSDWDDDDFGDSGGCTVSHEGHQNGDESRSYAGVGAVVRFRPSHFVGLQLDLDLLQDTDPEDGSSRQLLELDTSLLVYFAHTERFELYGSFGFGSAAACWSADSDDCSFGKGSAFGLHTGLGAQLVFARHFRLFAELRGQVLVPLQGDRLDGSAQSYYTRDPLADSRIIHDVEPAGAFFSPSLSVGGTFGL